MTKELVGSFRKGGSKWKLYRDIDTEGFWTVMTDRMVFNGVLSDLKAFCEKHGLEFGLLQDTADVLSEALEVAEEVAVEALIEALPDAEEGGSEEPSEDVPLVDSPDSSETAENGIQTEEDSGTEKPPEAVSEDSKIAAELDAQIADLEAKKAALKKGE